uniref:KH domain-containing protein At4g18375 n=1 Tax=Rhizophora mucronata TaxID=61149 RepID=A0A2P2MN51_RHIMU
MLILEDADLCTTLRTNLLNYLPTFSNNTSYLIRGYKKPGGDLVNSFRFLVIIPIIRNNFAMHPEQSILSRRY